MWCAPTRAVFKEKRMPKFIITQTRTFEVEVESDDLAHAAKIAEAVVAKYPEGIMRTLSIYAAEKVPAVVAVVEKPVAVEMPEQKLASYCSPLNTA
jgi:hypothetical protein